MIQVTVLTGGPKVLKCSEDDDFMSAFDKLMTDTIQARSQESVKVPTLDIAVPMHLRGQKKERTGMIKPNIGALFKCFTFKIVWLQNISVSFISIFFTE